MPRLGSSLFICLLDVRLRIGIADCVFKTWQSHKKQSDADQKSHVSLPLSILFNSNNSYRTYSTVCAMWLYMVSTGSITNDDVNRRQSPTVLQSLPTAELTTSLPWHNDANVLLCG